MGRKLVKKEGFAIKCKVREDEEQIALMTWVEYAKSQYPELKLLHHIPNGGKRNKAEAGRLKAMGVKPGVPDLFLPAPRRSKKRLFHGLYIEMKVGSNITSKEQAEFIQALKEQGYAVMIAYGADEARLYIEEYLKLEREAK